MNKTLMSLLFVLFLAVPTFGQNPPPANESPASPAAPAPVVVEKFRYKDHHPDIHSAMRKLRDAKLALEKSRHDYGGHKAKAIVEINRALLELRAALNHEKD